MDWWNAPEYWLSRLVFQRGLGALYLLAFVSAAHQFRPLLGSAGLTPIPSYLRRTSIRAVPTLFQLHYSDRFFAAIAWSGAAIAAATAAGLTDAVPVWASTLIWLVLWALYLSIVNVGQVWYAFGWESMLVETGFLAAFLGNASVAPPTLVLWLLRWLLFRVEFGAGLIKVRGDPCWRDLTCLNYHHETQPIPGPLSWWFHRLPRIAHKAEVLGNHVAQLVVPFALFTPQPVASIAAAVIIVTQLWLVLSGNFAWLNWLTILLACTVVDGSLVGLPPAHPAPLPGWYGWLAVAVTALVVVLSYQPARNLLSRHPAMNAVYNPLHLVNSYGAFGSIGRRRHEVVIEGTDDPDAGPEAVWREYEFFGKPGAPSRRPPQLAPYHLRLDWLLWFAALSPAYARPWLLDLLHRLTTGDAGTLRLVRVDPFPDRPPAAVRARLYHYAFTTWSERRRTGHWWRRRPIGAYTPVIRRHDDDANLGTDRGSHR